MGGTIGDVANRLPMPVETTIFDPAASNPTTSSEYSETSKCVRNPEVWASRGSRKYKIKIERESNIDTYDNKINQLEEMSFEQKGATM